MPNTIGCNPAILNQESPHASCASYLRLFYEACDESHAIFDDEYLPMRQVKATEGW